MKYLLTIFAGWMLALAAPSFAADQTDPAPTAPSIPPIIPTGQLDDSVTPTAYRLDLTVDPAKPRFSGHVEIDAVVKQVGVNRAGQSSFYLHGRDLTMQHVVAKIGAQTVAAKWQQVDPTGVARLDFSSALPAGPITLVFDYDAAFAEVPSGLFRVKVGDDWYSWSQFESIDARAAYPGFDQPGYKQTFTVTLRTPPGLIAVSNTPELAKTTEAGLEVHRFAPTPPLPTYLLAIMVGPFAVAEGAAPPSPQRAVPLPMRIISTQQNAGKLSYALAESQRIVMLLEDYFGTAFPYAKLDQITAPIMPGAMENAGADLYQDSLLALDPGAATAQKRAFGMVVSHELSHQWFGDLVTPKWWDDIWLNESFANWMGFRIGQKWRPELNLGAGALAEGFGAMGTDALIAGRPIQQAITTNTQIDAAFDAITYGKGGQVVAMMANYIGDAKFRNGVRAYLAAHRYGNATSDDFFKALAQAAGDPLILPAMQSFTRQQGVPLLTFTGGDGHYLIQQSRYARLGTTPPPTHWTVPLCVSRDGLRLCLLMDREKAVINLDGQQPLIPNAGGAGYYRFELPRAEWDRLIAVSDHLPGGEALALADSLRASFMAGRGDAGQLAALARVMVNNPDSHAAAAAMSGLDLLAAADMLDRPAAASYRQLIGELVRPQLAATGFDPRAGAYAKEDPERSQLRVQMVERLAGDARDEPLRKQLGAAAAAWLSGDHAALDPAWFGEAFAVHVASGGLPAAKRLLAMALASQDALFRPAALDAVAGSGNLGIARWVLGKPDARLRQSEQFSMLSTITRTKATRDLGYRQLQRQLDHLSGSGGIFFASRVPQMLLGFCSVKQADRFAHDLRPRLTGKSGELELERVIERVRDCGILHDARAKGASAAIKAITIKAITIRGGAVPPSAH